MFNNPLFTQEQSKVNNSNSSQGRPSVQSILDKYEVRNSLGQGARFTFQTGSSPAKQLLYEPQGDRQTFGNMPAYRTSVVTKTTQQQDQPRDSNLQLLASIDESNLSKVLSEFSIISEAQDYNQLMNKPKFSNPLDLKQTPQFIVSPRGQRVTFGEQYAHDFKADYQTQNPQHYQQATNNDISRSYIGEDEIYEDMSMLRDKVLGLLQVYSVDIKDSKSLKNVKQKVQQDAQLIAQEYSQIVDKVNQTDISAFTNLSFESQLPQNPKKEIELNMMFNLVEEFLNKFEPGKEQTNYSMLIKNKLATSQQKRPTPQAQTSNQIQVKNLQPQYFTAPTMNKFDQTLDLSVLPSFPAISPDDTFYQHQNIPEDKLKNKLLKLKKLLLVELDQSHLPYTRGILSDMIHNLNDILTANDPQTVKTVVYKIEMGIKDLRLEDQGSLKLYNYMAKAIKATNKRLGSVQNPQNAQQSPYQDNKTIKRKFFDLALKVKNQLPSDHPSKQVMVSLLFDDFVQAQLPESQMEAFIRQKLLF